MSEAITTTQLLDFLVKADKVSSHTYITKVTNFYRISIHADWDENSHFYTQTTYITRGGSSTSGSSFDDSDYEFFTMSSMLDYLVEKEKEREMKRQKRQELLSRLTDEEKELLGVK